MIDGRPRDAAVAGQTVSAPERTGTDRFELTTVTLTVPAPASAFSVSVLARNRHGWGPAESRRLEAVSAGSPVPRGDAEQPALYLLAIGVSDYRADRLDLRYAAKDASDIVEVMSTQRGRAYTNVFVKRLVDREATGAHIREGLEWLQREASPHDVVMVFIAGHGVNVNGAYYYLPSDADPTSDRPTFLPGDVIRDALSALPGKTLLFLDTCYSGEIWGAGGAGTRGVSLSADSSGFANELSAAENGIVVITSSSGRQPSLESTAWNNGAFTFSLRKAIGGAADPGKSKRIMVVSLASYVMQEVATLTNGQQTPTWTSLGAIQNFPIAVI
jgi:uncharacterized caspase-like protein